MAASTTSFLFKVLFICLAFDIVRRFFEKPLQIPNSKNDQNQKNDSSKNNYEEKLKNEKINNKLNDDDEDNDFVDSKKKTKKEEKLPQKNKKKEEDDNDYENYDIKEVLTISYDKKSFEKYFNTLKNEIMGNFTYVYIDEKEYPLPSNKKFFSKFTFFTQMGVSVLIFASQKFKNSVSFIPPNVFEMIDKNKWYIMIANFLAHQWLNRFLSTTGAFEIDFGGKKLFSKLETNRLPKESDIHAKLKKILKKSKGKKKEKDDDDDDDIDEDL